jgi:phage terminase small subunit
VTKLSAQQEAFCRNVVEGMNQTEAYTSAGYADTSSAHANASRLIAIDKVAARINELRQNASEKTGVTVERLTNELWWVFDAAKEASDLTNARQAVMDLAKLNGRIVDLSKAQTENVHFTISDEPMTDEEWEAEYGEKDSVETPARPAGSLN